MVTSSLKHSLASVRFLFRWTGYAFLLTTFFLLQCIFVPAVLTVLGRPVKTSFFTAACWTSLAYGMCIFYVLTGIILRKTGLVTCSPNHPPFLTSLFVASLIVLSYWVKAVSCWYCEEDWLISETIGVAIVGVLGTVIICAFQTLTRISKIRQC